MTKREHYISGYFDKLGSMMQLKMEGLCSVRDSGISGV
jgi:hypothetical protein